MAELIDMPPEIIIEIYGYLKFSPGFVKFSMTCHYIRECSDLDVITHMKLTNSVCNDIKKITYTINIRGSKRESKSIGLGICKYTFDRIDPNGEYYNVVMAFSSRRPNLKHVGGNYIYNKDNVSHIFGKQDATVYIYIAIMSIQFRYKNIKTEYILGTDAFNEKLGRMIDY